MLKHLYRSSKKDIDDGKSKESKAKFSKMDHRKQKAEKRKVQTIIPYKKLYYTGIAQLNDDRYSATVKINDINYQMISDSDREEIFTIWMECLNSHIPETGANITIHNHSRSIEEFKDSICIKHQGDALDQYRDEMNQVMLENIKSGNNNIISDKYLTFAVSEDTHDDALRELNIILTDLSRRLNGVKCHIENNRFLTGEQRVKLLNKIMEPQREIEFSYDHLNGLTTKDILSPDSMDFTNKSHFMIGKRFCKTIFLKNYSTELNDAFLSELSKLQYNFTINIHLKVLNNADAIELVKKQKSSMELNKISEQRKAQRAGYSEDMIPEDIIYSLKEAKNLLDDVKKRNQRLFQCQFVILLNCESKNELNELEKRINNIAKKNNLEFGKIPYLQEQGFQSSLPLCYSALPISRTLTTSSVGCFIPFTSMELLHTGSSSVYYGKNAVSGNLIIGDRTKLLNPSGFVLGKPGGGKSFAVKRESVYKILADPSVDIIYLDPEAEYPYIAELPGIDGAVVHINSTSNNYLNPLEGDIKDKDFIPDKIEFLQSMIATIIGTRQMSPTNISLIDRVARTLYKNYEDSIAKYSLDKRKTKPEMPTLTDFYKLMKKQPEAEANQIATAMEVNVTGTNNFFAKKSTVDVKSRVVVYEIRDLPASMKSLAMQVTLESIWQKVIANFKAGRMTWVYIDEISIFLLEKYCRRYLQLIWKRARKYNAVLTGITQNVEELLNNTDTRTMISNSEFVLMLNQAANDRDALEHLFGISKEQMSYISNSIEGNGLLSYGNSLIPFIDNFPADTELYRAMTTKPEERKQILLKKENVRQS